MAALLLFACFENADDSPLAVEIGIYHPDGSVHPIEEGILHVRLGPAGTNFIGLHVRGGVLEMCTIEDLCSASVSTTVARQELDVFILPNPFTFEGPGPDWQRLPIYIDSSKHLMSDLEGATATLRFQIHIGSRSSEETIVTGPITSIPFGS